MGRAADTIDDPKKGLTVHNGMDPKQASIYPGIKSGAALDLGLSVENVRLVPDERMLMRFEDA